MVGRIKPLTEGLGNIVDDYECHCPGEISEANVRTIRGAVGDDHDIYCIASGLQTRLAVFQHNYHSRIYRYNEETQRKRLL